MSDLSHAMKQNPWLAELVGLIKQVVFAHLFGASPAEKQAILDHPALADHTAPAPVVTAVPEVVAAAPAPIDYDQLAAALRRQASTAAAV